MSNASEWGSFIEISAMSHLYRRDFIIFEANNGPQTKICNGYGNTIYLFHSPETKHFDVVYTKEFITTSSYCQSLVYEILYDGVYQLKDLPYAVDKMLHDKVPTNHIEYFMSENVERRKKQKERAKIFIEATTDDNKDRNNAVALKCKHHTEDLERASLLKESLSIFVFNRSLIQLENVCMNCLNVNSAKDLLDNGITPFPYKVAKALDPDIYRNIEFDVWSELRRELRYGARYSDGSTLQVGVKCLVKIEPEQSGPYHCHIQEMRPDGGPCLVFIEELGEKRVVNYDQLEPLPQEELRPWAPPYRYSRANSQFLTLSQMLQQIGNITRKQGLNKAKNKPKSGAEDLKSPDKASPQKLSKMSWDDEKPPEDMAQYVNENIDFSAYQHLDFINFDSVEVDALPLMVDCRPAAGPAPHDIAHSAPNGAPPEAHQNQAAANNEMGAHGITSPASVRASTPATSNALTPYTGGNPPGGVGGPGPVYSNVGFAGGVGTVGVNGMGGMAPAGVGPGPAPVFGGVGGVNCAPYMCGKLLWCAAQSPPPHAPHPPPPPPPHGVNPHVFKSVQANGADLPMNDIPTLRYYFNLGVECMWAAYGPPPPHHPPRHYSPRDLAQDMQQMAIHDGRALPHAGGEQNHKHAPRDNKPPLAQGKGAQRPLLGPR
ncbi:protein ovarian tumor locus-like [Ostrinia nubilalis]|uniref:protein ovarian tumor locus-like n=1 Tax=Ostrinia nubilalis TaxID=29057 RepID=UPI00308250DA